MAATNKTLTFDEAVNAIYVAVRRGKEVVILKVKKVMTRFLNGEQKRIIILSDGSHYADDNSFSNKMWAVAKV